MNKRLDRLEAKIKQRVKEFWAQFSTDELEALVRGTPETLSKVERLGGNELLTLNRAIMTPEELAELEQIEKELQLRKAWE